MKRLRHYLPDPARIREIKSLQFLGDRIYSPNLWYLNRHSVARAFAVGLWAMYTPPLPWQQIIAAIGAIYFGANLPIAVALVWITNPLTWLPMYYIAYEVGAIALGSETFSFQQFSQLFDIEKAITLGAPFLVGCFILMNVGAIIGYFGVQWLWIKTVREAASFRRLRNMPFDTAEMCRLPFSSFQRYLSKHDKALAHTKQVGEKK